MKTFALIAIVGICATVTLASSVSAMVKPGIDQQTVEQCQEYGESEPWRSIPKARQKWLEQQGFDYKNYDYTQDCINQKLPIEEVK